MGEISSILPSHIAAGPSKAGQVADPAPEKKLKKVCADFEAMLAFQMIKTMRQSVPRNGFLKPSQAQQTYEMMLDQKMAEELAGKSGGLGLQKMLYNQMTRHHPKKD
jgi:peptidoglycan hydrolase FlgJ